MASREVKYCRRFIDSIANPSSHPAGIEIKATDTATGQTVGVQDHFVPPNQMLRLGPSQA